MKTGSTSSQGPRLRERSVLRTPRGFSLIELLVVIGIIALLLALVLPALNRARATSRATQCATQLREMGRAMQLYANDNHGWIPRDYTPSRPHRRPYWLMAIGPYLEERNDWGTVAPEDQAGLVAFLSQIPIVHCAEHPNFGEAPGTYVMNAFMFESDPTWDPSPPVKLSAVLNPSQVIWLAEVSPLLGEARRKTPVAYHHDVFSPAGLPNQASETITDKLHMNSSNVLLFDGSTKRIEKGKFELKMFDDGIRSRKIEWIHQPPGGRPPSSAPGEVDSASQPAVE